MKLASLLAALILLSNLSVAATKHTPLPEKILTAKTVYIDNLTGNARVGDHAYESLLKSKCFVIVQDKDKADLIVRLSFSGRTRAVVRPEDDGSVSAEEHEQAYGRTILTIIDVPTQATLWTNSHHWERKAVLPFDQKNATAELVRDFCERVKQQRRS
ncbi:MAG: hypothetical protein CXZ00_15295 [Acidobacteria bacterium]|nr:MAG: hypothetical protein CXZ00_15295 [Acidobacteriota bacterium]